MSKKKINVFGLLAVSMAAAMLLNNSGMTVLAAGLDENFDESEETIEVSDNDEEDELIINSSELLDENPVLYSYGNLIYELDEKGNAVITGNTITEDTDLIIPSKIDNHDVVSIGKSAFDECSNLTSVTIPNSVTSICESAFRYCSNLTSATIPNSVISFGDTTFCGCSNLKSVTIPNKVTSIGKFTFWQCRSLTSITIPDSVTSIGDFAFDYCSGLTSVIIPDSVTSIGEWAFYECGNLTSVTLSKSLKEIKTRTFNNCHKLESIVIYPETTEIAEDAFGDNKNFTIYGIDGSYAEEWANSHGVKFAVIYTVTDIFDDVKPTDWFVKAVQYVYDHGIMAGVNGGKSFDPHGKLTREQFTQVLYAYEGKPEVINMSGFTDVNSNAWYAKSVYWAKEKGITGGKPDGTFGVGQNISRQDLAVMLYTYAKYKNYDLTKNDNALDNFNDSGKISSYAKDAMKWAVTQGIISGKGNGKVDPIGNATRAECATMIMKLIEKNK